MGLTCYCCSRSLPSIDFLLYHLRKVHTVQITGQEVRCGQDDCPRMFTCFRALINHLTKQHSALETDVWENCVRRDPEQLDESMDCEMASDDDNNADNAEFIDDGEDLQEHLSRAILSFMCILSAKAMANVAFVMEQLRGLMEVVAKFCCRKVEKLCDLNGIERNGAERQLLLMDLQKIPTYFDEVGNVYNMEKTLINQGIYIEPVEVSLGTREERHYTQCGTESRSIRVEDTMQYVPLGDLLKTLSGPLRKCLSYAQPIARPGYITDFTDTASFRYNKVCCRHPDAFQLHFFIDAFETSNELGSHTSVHKLEDLYMTIRNAPVAVHSQLNNIFLVGLWYYEDVKKYGHNKILRP